MGRGTRLQILIALGIVMLIGIALHFRIWTIDHRLSANDADIIRKQFDLASRDALDESADWRRRFDFEVERAAKCNKELKDVKQKLPESGTSKIEMLQKENMDLLELVESLKQELEAEKLKCSRV